MPSRPTSRITCRCSGGQFADRAFEVAQLQRGDSIGLDRQLRRDFQSSVAEAYSLSQSSPHVAHASLVDSTATAIPNDPISSARRRNFARTITVVRGGA
jgi:predicted Mrr-cat superfamily restriction endonuclease